MNPSMHAGDPFAAFNGFGEDPTVTQPLPRRPAAAASARGAPSALPLAMEALMSGGLNPLVAAATPLLLCAPRIRATVRHADPGALRQALAEGLRAFETQARSRGQPHEQVIAARYVLCTMLDEAAASTAWGGSGAWSAHSLLVQFHNETWGGEKVFRMLSRLTENVDANRRLLELLYLVLALGFEGRFRVLDGGRAQLSSLRERLAEMLHQGRPAPDTALSPRWQPEPVPVAPLRTGMPARLRLLAGLAVLSPALLFVGLQARLALRADPIHETLAGLQPRQPVATAAPVMAAPSIARLLEPDVRAGLVTVTQAPDRVTVSIVGDRLFRSGEALMAPDYAPLLARIGAAMAALPGPIQVTGHTDSQPMAATVSMSNQQLSLARAQAVQRALQQQLPAARLAAEGRADSQPVADNRTAAGRARNRRVDITLLTPAGRIPTP